MIETPSVKLEYRVVVSLRLETAGTLASAVCLLTLPLRVLYGGRPWGVVREISHERTQEGGGWRLGLTPAGVPPAFLLQGVA